MKTTKIADWLSLEEVSKRYEREQDKRKKKKWLCIRLWMVRARTGLELAGDSWLSLSSVRQLTAWYNKFWPWFIDNKPWKWWDRFNRRVDREKEKLFFKSITELALEWKYRTANEIAEAYKKEVRSDIWKDSIYHILYRLWRKSKVPRQSHPKKKNDQKKSLKNSLMP